MKVTLLRHATRGISVGDVPLNNEGIHQAQHLATLSQMKKHKTIFCSPKRRAQMTVEPLAKELKLKIQLMESLDQMGNNETESQFIARVKNFLDKIEQYSASSPILVCTHSDWLHVATQKMPTDELDLDHHLFQCAEFMRFEINSGLWVKKV